MVRTSVFYTENKNQLLALVCIWKVFNQTLFSFIFIIERITDVPHRPTPIVPLHPDPILPQAFITLLLPRKLVLLTSMSMGSTRINPQCLKSLCLIGPCGVSETSKPPGGVSARSMCCQVLYSELRFRF